MHFLVMALSDIQAEYTEFIECMITLSHITEKAFKDINFVELSQYLKISLDVFIKG